METHHRHLITVLSVKLTKIFNVIGTPTEEEVRFATVHVLFFNYACRLDAQIHRLLPDASTAELLCSYVRGKSKSQSCHWETKYKAAPLDLVQLVSKLLVFDPAARLGASAATQTGAVSSTTVCMASNLQPPPCSQSFGMEQTQWSSCMICKLPFRPGPSVR